ncbi:hypothetical protein RRG08_056824 [Elysia crispata]|uniref:Uncharacterized protein n=1 Tax=Elysia crispata TaxID=231223 RepID=A0AAE1ABK8_9GAST|nr:hypothetical protein RRG08_056824 [Elysia crispata]
MGKYQRPDLLDSQGSIENRFPERTRLFIGAERTRDELRFTRTYTMSQQECRSVTHWLLRTMLTIMHACKIMVLLTGTMFPDVLQRKLNSRDDKRK